MPDITSVCKVEVGGGAEVAALSGGLSYDMTLTIFLHLYLIQVGPVMG